MNHPDSVAGSVGDDVGAASSPTGSLVPGPHRPGNGHTPDAEWLAALDPLVRDQAVRLVRVIAGASHDEKAIAHAWNYHVATGTAASPVTRAVSRAVADLIVVCDVVAHGEPFPDDDTSEPPC